MEGSEPEIDVADQLKRAHEAALEEDWESTREHAELALGELENRIQAGRSDSGSPSYFARVNWLIVFGVAAMIIGGILWFRADRGLENISDDLRAIETFTDDENRMATILHLEDSRSSRQISRAAGIGMVVGGALLTVYGFPRGRR